MTIIYYTSYGVCVYTLEPCVLDFFSYNTTKIVIVIAVVVLDGAAGVGRYNHGPTTFQPFRLCATTVGRCGRTVLALSITNVYTYIYIYTYVCVCVCTWGSV